MKSLQYLPECWFDINAYDFVWSYFLKDDIRLLYYYHYLVWVFFGEARISCNPGCSKCYNIPENDFELLILLNLPLMFCDYRHTQTDSKKNSLLILVCIFNRAL